MYSEEVMEHFTNPRNIGVIENADGVGEVGNAKCGDILKIYLKIEKDIIVDVKFKTFGCAAAIATSSMATVLMKGKKIEEALKVVNSKFIAKQLGGLPSIKLHCSFLAEKAFKLAIADYYHRKGVDSNLILSKAFNVCAKQ
ncbi:MAG: iron-sulfur cluster assembly scaffold protein [Oscillospiraceae bacterium]|jgi:nitrogen fixation NifU-like protein|nr:iron-sulfur cluster assembly scaffold protein [Oscillospiraceae bacterium]